MSCYMSEWFIYDICKMIVGICLNAVYIILLKWGLIYMWMPFLCHYENDKYFMPEYWIYVIINIRIVIFLNVVLMILLT